MQVISGNHRPGLEMSPMLRLAHTMPLHFYRSSSHVPCAQSFWKLLRNQHLFAHVPSGKNAKRATHSGPGSKRHVLNWKNCSLEFLSRSSQFASWVQTGGKKTTKFTIFAFDFKQTSVKNGCCSATMKGWRWRVATREPTST